MHADFRPLETDGLGWFGKFPYDPKTPTGFTPIAQGWPEGRWPTDLGFSIATPPTPTGWCP